MEPAKPETRLERMHRERRELQHEIKQRTIGYILAALGLVAGLAWNEAIKSFIDSFFPTPGHDLIVKFIYAFFITIIIVIVTVYLLKLTQDKK